MYNLEKILILSIIALFTEGCFCKKDVNTTNNQSNVDYSTSAIDLFGKKLCGKYQDVINDIYELPIISLIEIKDSLIYLDKRQKFTHIVNFCEVPCGMNVCYSENKDDTITIEEIIFLTSETDRGIFLKFISEITNYYGIANVSDDTYNNYSWFYKNDQTIRVRSVHSPEGGWTAYFHIHTH